MRSSPFSRLTFKILVLSAFLLSVSARSVAQLKAGDFVLLSGPNSPGTTLIGSSITINGGSVGAYKLVQTTGNATINSNIYSADKIIIANSNVLKGLLASAANYPYSPLSTGTILSVGSSTSITGNIDVYGNVVIGGGAVLGKVTLPSPSAGNNFTNYTYSGPNPSLGVVKGNPTLPTLPTLPQPFVINPATYTVINTTTTGNLTVGPGNYGNIDYSGNKALKLVKPGIYIFNNIKMTGSSNSLIFDFANTAGNYQIYIRNNADFGKLNATVAGGGNASRIYVEVGGTGNGTSIAGSSFIIANGSSGGGSKWLGTVYAHAGGINIGSGTGSSSLTGAFWSSKAISIQSGVTVTYAQYNPCTPPDVIAGIGTNPFTPIDSIPLDFTGHTTLTAKSNTSGTSFTWQASNGGKITSANANTATIVVEAAGNYIVSAYTTDQNCVSKDTVVVAAKVPNIIGGELLSIYLNYNANTLPPLDSFFAITSEYVKIEVIVVAGNKQRVLDSLVKPSYGLVLSSIYPNGLNLLTITGDFPIANLLKLNSLRNIIKYAMPYYRPFILRDFSPSDTLKKTGLVISAGDTTIGTYLVRKGYQLDGDSIKIGVLSDSYAKITQGSVATEPYQPVPGSQPQTFSTTTVLQDIRNGDLPGDSNRNGFLKNVHVVQDFLPARLTDEGRAMLQIIHDVAPKAELYFRTGFYTAGDFAQGIEELEALGCDIIVDDITYMAEPFLRDGVVAKTVNNVKDSGVAYFSSAGNFSNKSYEKDFVAVNSLLFPGKKVHNFGTSTNVDLFQQIKMAPGSYIIAFQWDDNIYSLGETVGTNYDLDIFLTPNEDGTGLIGYNRDNLGADPFEFIPVTINGNSPTDSSTFNMVIVNNTTSGNPQRIKYVVYRGGMRIVEYNNEGNSTITGHANAIGAITIGAVRFNHVPGHPLLPAALSGITKPQIESFSSIGGTWVGGIQRSKPDMAGPDGGNTTLKMGQDYPNEALDGYSNFFGTSAAAPHAAAAAALILQARKRFFPGNPVTTPDQLKELFQSSAKDMRPTGLVGYDYAAGSGLIDADALMRTIANPTPYQIKLQVPADKIPGAEPFLLTITGENFSTNTVVKIINDGDTTTLTPIFIDTENGVLQVMIPPFTGNPEIKAYTQGKTDYDDGGHSNGKRFYEATIVVRAVNTIKKYGEAMPVLDTIITYNDTLLHQTTSHLSLADVGLTGMIVETDATASSNVGPYEIRVIREFDPNTHDSVFLKKFHYQFFNAEFKIEPLPLTITVQNETVTYGEQIPNIQFAYAFDAANITNPAALLSQIQSEHQAQLATDALGHDILGLVNGQARTIVNGQARTIVNGQAITIVNGQARTIVNGVEYPVVNAQALTIVNNIVTDTSGIDLTSSQINNLSFLVTDETLQNSRQINNVSGTTKIVDVTQESLINFNLNGAQTLMLTSVSDIGPKGVVDQESYTNGQALTIVNGQARTIVNGNVITEVNGRAVTIVNRQAVTIVNGQEVPVSFSNNRTGVILAETEIGQGLSPLKSLNIITGLDVGQHSILAGALNDGNFTRTYIPGALTVNKASLQVKADNQSRLYGEANPPLTVAYTGFVYGESLQNSDITGAPAVSTTATPTSAVSPPTYPITVAMGTLNSSNYAFSFVNGALTINNNPCLQVHSPFTNFGNTASLPKATSLWFNLVTKVSGQLSQPGDYLLFKSGTITFNNIGWTPLPLTDETILPEGKIEAVDPALVPNGPVTRYDATNKRWITQVPAGFASTSDIFVTGAIINSSSGFKKLNGNTNTVTKGLFLCNKPFSDQWAYAIAAYQVPVAQGGPYVSYTMIANPGDVVSINGNYRAATPKPILPYLVQGASGGGGNNYTGSNSSFQNFTVTSSCVVAPPPITMLRGNPSQFAEDTKKAQPGSELIINPNPTSGYFSLSFVPLLNGNAKMELYSINGRKVLEANYGLCKAGSTNIRKVDVSKLPAGIYMVRLWNAGKATSKKIVITR